MSRTTLYPITLIHGQDPDADPASANPAKVNSCGEIAVSNAYDNIINQYRISDLDTSAIPMYFGYVDQNGNWYIMCLSTSNGTARYCKGSSGYAAAWTGRAELTYDYFSNVW